MFFNNQICFNCKSIGINVLKVQRRWKNKKDHWSTLARKQKPTDRALEYFDDFYKKVFDRKWPSLRLGLLSENKYCAVINNYSDSERIEQELGKIGAINVKDLIHAQISHRDSKFWKKNLENISKLDRDINTSSEVKSEIGNPVTPEEAEAQENEKFQETDRLIIPWETGGDSSSALYEFIPATRLKGMEDFVPESQHYSYYKNEADFSPQIEAEDHLDFPEALKVYSFEVGNCSRFPKPKRGSTGVTDYYLLDGSSLLPVLSLGLQPGDRVLDMCSAPGGKSVVCLQTLMPGKLVSNDISLSRLNRLKKVFNEFFYNLDKMTASEEIIISNEDARTSSHLGQFNKILVDVPCTTDRYSVIENDNNIFKTDRVKERIKLPELQTEILISALKQVEDGGTVVYSTCSLSPVQNDGVVQMALKRIWEETNDNIIIKDMSRVLEPYRALYKFASSVGLRYGNLVVPYLPSNFGPMYFCKFIKRNSV